MQAERHALEGCVLEMSGKAAALGKWLAENEKKQVSGECTISLFYSSRSSRH